MKRYISSVLLVTMMAASIPFFATTASAQRRDRCRQNGGGYSQSGYNEGYNQRDESYRNDNGYYEDQTYSNSSSRYGQPNVYDRHRKAINLGVATGAGAIVGALLGGRKGALIGAAAGVAGGAIITKKQRSRNYGYYR